MARPRSLSTRLLLPLLATVAVVMTAFAFWSLTQRQRILTQEARRETQAYATALGLALDAAFREPGRAGVADIVERISREPSIYAVLVYETGGLVLSRPDTMDLGPVPPQVDSVLADGARRQVERTLGDVDVFSVVSPVRDPSGQVVGAYEVAQPLAFVRDEMRRTRIRFLLNTLVLFGVVTALLQGLVRRLVSDPVRRLTDGARAFGEGRLDHRIRLGEASGELAAVAAEFNRMAESLEQARVDLLRGAEERLALARHVRHSEKMAAIGQLAAGLAHEIGAPLHVIRGRADLLARRSARLEQEPRDLRIIVEQIDRITGIVRSLLDFARHREPQLTRMDLAALVDDVIELLAAECRRSRIEVRRNVLGETTVRGDRDQLQQVVLNVILNAVQALADVADARSVSVDVVGPPAGPGDQVTLTIADSGPGIPPDVGERIFEPFFTTKAAGDGTGLGLAVARRIAEEHGGALSLVPSDGEGARLRLQLPHAPEDAHAP